MGGGKTTVLGAAAILHKSIKPRQYFAKGGRYDVSMVDWKIEYDFYDSGKRSSRTVSYPRSKWDRTAVDREVLTFGVIRTLPATERKEFLKFMGGSFRGFGEHPLGESALKAVENILGKRDRDYLLVSGDRKSSKDNQIYAVKNGTEGGYSEFHFGAGEASVMRIVNDIERSGDGSLILIEEIENGLHPVATKKLVEYLVGVAKRKSCQVIFTTHSNDALSPLPDEAVWSCANGNLSQGKLDVRALRAL